MILEDGVLFLELPLVKILEDEAKSNLKEEFGKKLEDIVIKFLLVVLDVAGRFSQIPVLERISKFSWRRIQDVT